VFTDAVRTKNKT